MHRWERSNRVNPKFSLQCKESIQLVENYKTVARSCEYGNEHLNSTKGGGILSGWATSGFSERTLLLRVRQNKSVLVLNLVLRPKGIWGIGDTLSRIPNLDIRWSEWSSSCPGHFNLRIN
jgi:hypothetical protein